MLDLSYIDLLVVPEEMAMTSGSTCGWNGWKTLIALHVFKGKVIGGCVCGEVH